VKNSPVIVTYHESWKLAEPFTISRGTKTRAEVIVVEIDWNGRRGRGECVPYPRYGESVDSVLGQVGAVIPGLTREPERAALQDMLPPGAARNALDCALWDVEAKRGTSRAWDLAGIDVPPALTCAYTLSLSDVDSMYRSAVGHSGFPLLKIKVSSDGVLDRVRAVARGAPGARLIVDANESWTTDLLMELLPELAEIGVALIEQPLPAGDDERLADFEHSVPLAADESCHTSTDVPALVGRYDVVNIKLDKTGGLTEALTLMKEARSKGLRIMVGCMIGTSLAMAPATVIGCRAEFVDLDGPLLLARDREPGLEYDSGSVAMPDRALWG